MSMLDHITKAVRHCMSSGASSVPTQGQPSQTREAIDAAVAKEKATQANPQQK